MIDGSSGVPQGRMSDVGAFALQPGQSIGRYQIVAVLGQGGFGITYRARDARLSRDVAIKEYLPLSLAVRQGGTTVLPRSTDTTEDFAWGRDRFVAEGSTLASLQDAPAIVRVFDFLEANGTAYIVMELVAGETLDSRLRQKGALSPAEIDGLLWPLLDGLERVHEAGFLHRDIKPANILLGPTGRPTLIDFGASRAAMAGRSTALTAIFTPGYAAVEQMTSAKQGPWTDIYGVSATLCHAIMGAAPPGSIERMLDDHYVSLAERQPVGFAAALLAGVDSGLAVRVADRPQSIAAWRPMLRGGVSAVDSDATVVVPRARAQDPVASSQPPPAATPARRRLSLYAGAAAAVVLVALGGWYVLSPGKPTQQSVQSLTADELEKALAERRQADAAAAEKRRLEEEAQKQAAADAEAKRQADEALAKAQTEREKAEQELAKLKAELEAQKQAAANRDAKEKQAAIEQQQRQAEAAMAEKRRLEEEAQKQAAADAEKKRLADEALARAQAARQKADEEAARQTADLEARQKAEADAKAKADAKEAKAKANEAEAKADAEAKLAADKKAAETAEIALKFDQPMRQHIQVALTSLGFDTRGADGNLGPRSREMIAAWQKGRNEAPTGFLSVAQEQALLAAAANAVAKFDEQEKKKEEARKKEEEEKKKVEEAAKAQPPATPQPPPAQAATPAPSAPPATAAVAPPPMNSAVLADGTYTGAFNWGSNTVFVVTLQLSGGRGSATMRLTGGGNGGGGVAAGGSFSLTISPAGEASGSGQLVDGEGRPSQFAVNGRAGGGRLKLAFDGLRRPFEVTLAKASP